MSEIRVIDSRALGGPKTAVSLGGDEGVAGVVQYIEYHRDPLRGRVVIVPAKDAAACREIVDAPSRPEAFSADIVKARAEIAKDEAKIEEVTRVTR